MYQMPERPVASSNALLTFPFHMLAPHPTLPQFYPDPQHKRAFVRDVFDHAAKDYNRIEWLMSLGSGSRYRNRALRNAGLKSNMRVLDVAIGTGLVAREEIAITGDPRLVIGLDPSAGMLEQCRKNLAISAVMGVAESLPFPDGHFDFVSMGYALRHVQDLAGVFAEYHRVLKPGARLCILEITRPMRGIALLRFYMKRIVPLLSKLAGGSSSQTLWRYYWDTIEACVEPAAVISALSGAGFKDVVREVELGIFSRYSATR
jgi:demethylmenaquinone methyltransferase/2-methoxy-6-polyprenyl-1,4-benzoquinol methylase